MDFEPYLTLQSKAVDKSRRNFIVTSGSVFFVAGCSSLDRLIFEPEQQSLSEVVIIGGGLAGLTAALELKKRGISYTLFEASPRLGGRVLTRREVNSRGELSFTELGLTSILKSEVPFVDLLKELKVPLSSVSENQGELRAKEGWTQAIDAFQNRVAGVPEGRFLKVSAQVHSVTLENDRWVLSYSKGLLFETRRCSKLIVAVPPSQIKNIFGSLDMTFGKGIVEFASSLKMDVNSRESEFWKRIPSIEGGKSLRTATQIIPPRDFFHHSRGVLEMAIIGDYTSQSFYGRGAGAVESAQDAVKRMVG